MLKSKTYNALFLITAFTFGSGFNITSQLSAFVLLTAFLLIINLIVISFSDTSLIIPAKTYTNFFILLFFFITFYTMLFRGIGFEFLGSSKSGGMFYIKLFTILLLFVFLVKVKTTEKFISALFFCFFVSCVFPFLSDIIFLIHGGETFFNKLIPGSSTIEFYSGNADSLLRIQSASSLAEYLIVIMLAYKPPFHENGKLKLTKINISILIISLILTGLSGHRITLVGISLLMIFYYYYSFGIHRLIKPLLIGGAVGIGICLFAILQFEHLPASFQRTFSFLPFTPVNTVTQDASNSLDFRLLMATKAFTVLPDYYLIGKGFAFANYSVDFTDFFGIIDFFAEIGVFHNGLLGLLINLGTPGLITGLALFYSLYKFTNKRTALYCTGTLQRIVLVLKSKILLSFIYFIFLYGDVQTNFIEIIMLAIIFKFILHYINNKDKNFLTNESAV